jgi:plastocyanin
VRFSRAFFLASILISTGSLALMAATIPSFTVSQKGRMFLPGMLNIHEGETIRIVNDDGDLLHHAYIESDTFNFDSGDQEPGSKTDITFPKAGTFTVLCGIHPKMKLVVNVD